MIPEKLEFRFPYQSLERSAKRAVEAQRKLNAAEGKLSSLTRKSAVATERMFSAQRSLQSAMASMSRSLRALRGRIRIG